MKVVKIGLPVLFTFILTQSVSALGVKDNAAQHAHAITDSQIYTSTIQSAVTSQGADVQRKEKEAWNQYREAKNAVNAGVRSIAYANAIQSINEAIAQGEERPETFLLASRIYRGKGGVSYAKNYFSKASAIYLEDVIRYPESIGSNLTAAIILYAGDVRYWDTYSDCQKKAKIYADKVLELFKDEKIKIFKNRRDKTLRDKNREAFLEEAAALAFLVKENYKSAEKHFARAEKFNKSVNLNENEAKDNFVKNRFENKGNSLVKIVSSEETEALQKAGNCLSYAFFKKFTKQGKWYWPVTKQTEANKEFLLNCLTGFYL